MYRMSDEEFEAAVAEALDAMPEQFMEALQNVAVVWEEEPNAYHLGYDGPDYDSPSYGDLGYGDASTADADERANGEADGWTRDDASDWTDNEARATDTRGDAGDEINDLLGLFDGLSIVERANGYDDDIPDVITVFKGPHERCFNSREEIVEEIGKTIIHELGHYFGLDEDQLAAMGYE